MFLFIWWLKYFFFFNIGVRRLLVIRVIVGYVGGVVFFLLIVVGIFIFYCKCCWRFKRRDNLLDNEEVLFDNERGFD